MTEQLLAAVKTARQEWLSWEPLTFAAARTSRMLTALLSPVPLGRAGDPQEIAHAIVFIASPGSGFLTGQTIFLDGGITAA